MQYALTPKICKKYAVTSRHFWHIGTPPDQVLISFYREKLPEKYAFAYTSGL